MVTASMKRIIWGLGFFFNWSLSDYVLVIGYGAADFPIYQLVMLTILIIPLLIFKDDITSKKRR